MTWDPVRPKTLAAEAERLARSARAVEGTGDHMLAAHFWRRAQEAGRAVGPKEKRGGQSDEGDTTSGKVGQD